MAVGRNEFPCLVCGEKIDHLAQPEPMSCARCGKFVNGTFRCANGHHVCEGCYARHCNDAVLALCLSSTSRNPANIAQMLLETPSVHMHGVEHHFIVGAALLTAYHNSGGEVNLPKALSKMIEYGRQIPGGACGIWGACGAGISTGMFISLITGTTPLSNEERGTANGMTARSLAAISEYGGPRCCKRETFTVLD